MTDRLRYEEEMQQKLNDLPLPDENMAWADMKQRLEEDDDDRVVPIWLRGCTLWALLGVVLLGLGWWIIRPEKYFSDKESEKEKNNTEIVSKTNNKEKEQEQQQEEKEKQSGNSTTTNTVNTTTTPDNTISVPSTPSSPSSSATTTTEPALKTNSARSEGTARTRKSEKQSESGEVSFKTDGGKTTKKKNSPKATNHQPLTVRTKKDQSEKQKESEGTETKEQQQQEQKTTTPPAATADTLVKVNVADPVVAKKSDSIKKKEPQETAVTKTQNQNKEDSAKKKSFWFSAGLAMQQQIPIAGQKLNPYNSLGRKGSIADYIPSVYFRINRENKWFFQTEFKYGAPNFNKEFVFGQEVRNDTATQSTVTQSTTLKKTFYHQLPVTFNYYVLPNWSVGAGIVWNKFNGAVSSIDVVSRNNQTGIDTQLVKGKIVSTKDSAYENSFSKSYFQAVFESQYKWKRFSFGGRYAVGLEPYIKFTLPNGINRSERSSSLQFFIRYELWRSKKDK